MPWGYTGPAFITTIAVFLAFSLASLRSGIRSRRSLHWYALFSTCLLPASVVLQMIALFRAVRVEDVRPACPRVTVRWFAAAVVVMVIGVLRAALEVAPA